jgi:gliding motility-associated-like protein
MLLLGAFSAQAQSDQLDTRGRDFWVGFMKNASGGASLSLKIASTAATTGTVTVPLAGWSATFSVAANGVTNVDVPVAYECSGSETVQDRGVRIITQHPVTVTAVNYQVSTTDAMQVLPLTGLGTDYLVDAAPGTAPPYVFRSEFLVVATVDGTVVEITPSVNTLGGHPPGVPYTVNLNAGQSYQVQALAGTSDLTGTRIRGTAESGSCRPFAVFGGSTCAVISCAACDHVCEQMTPTNTWGMAFHTVSVGNIGTWAYRILARDNNTQVIIDGGAPITLNAGQYHLVLDALQPVCITANKPVSAIQLLEGQYCATIGDPALLVLIPDSRLSTSAVFTTLPTGQASFYYFVSIVVPTAGIGQATLDGTPIASTLFVPYTACSGYSQAKVPVAVGTHRIACPQGMAAYTYGYGLGESYFYTLANDMAVPPPVQDTLICSSTVITLAPPEFLTNAVWTMASAPNVVLATGNSYTFTPDHNDVYSIDGELGPSGCPRHYEFQVGVPVSSTLDVLVNSASTITICQGNSVQLSTNPPMDPQVFDMQWTPAATLSNPGISNPVAYPSVDTWYRLNVSSPVGCGTGKDSVLVHVQPSTVRSVRVTADDTQICAGDPSHLHAEVERVLNTDNFEGSTAPWWGSIQGGVPSSVCGSVSGQSLYFNGAGVRSATTGIMDLNAGGKVRFSLKIANGTAPCDNADPGEDVVLESSTNGSTWNILATFNEAAYPAFTPITFTIPGGQAGANTLRVRWRQLTNSGAGQDNWGLDNIEITRYENPVTGLVWTPSTGLSSATSATPTATPTVDTWYKATMTTPSGCSYMDSVLVHVSPAFSIAAINDTVLCGATGVQLQAHALSGGNAAPPGTTWSWSPAAGLSAANISNPVAHPAITTPYVVTAVNAIGCTDTEAVQITVSGLTALTATASDNSLCYGEQTQLHANVTSTQPYTVLWSPAGTLSSTTSINPTASPLDTTTYTCVVTDTPSGCSLSAIVKVDVAPAFTTQLTNDTTVCSSAGMQLHLVHDVPLPAQYAWSNAAFLNAGNVAEPTITVDTTATYVVTITAPGGCSVQDSVLVAVAFDNLITPVYLTACAGENLLLDAEFPGSTYDWTTGAITQSITVDTSGTYTATITDSQLCQAIRSFVVTFTPLPVVNLGPDLALCGETSHVIDAGSAGNNVLWNTGATTHQLTITANGTYSVAVSTPNGCTTRDTVYISMDPLPVDALQDMTPCAGSAPVLNAGNAGSTYLWNNNETTQTITASADGTYSVTITTPQHCTATYDAIVTFTPLPVVDLGPDLALCGETSHVIVAGNAGNSVLWNTGANTHQITITATGTYIAAVTTPNGCTTHDTVYISMDPLPANALQDITTCESTLPTLNAGNAGSTYYWNTGETTQTITAMATGTYACTITTPQNCATTYDAEVTLAPAVSVYLGRDTTLCSGQPLVLDAGNAGNTVVWNNGISGSIIMPTVSGIYTAQVSNGYCTASDSIAVQFLVLPNDILQDATACIGQTVTFDASNPGATYAWDNGSHASTITVDVNGTYNVVVTGVNGCPASFDGVAQFVPPPAVELGNDTVLCSGEVLVLHADNPGSSYTWSNGSAQESINVLTTGIYTVSVDNGYCAVNDSIHAIFNPVPDRLRKHDYIVCLDEDPRSVLIDAGNTGSTFQWSNGQHAQAINATSYGIYTVEITNAFGCSISDSARVTEFCRPTIFIPNTFTPDGDGVNETWGPVGNNIAEFTVDVFDRWGGVIFHGTSPAQFWDGTFNGQPVKNDIYAYRAVYKLQEDSSGKLGFEQSKLGHVQVLR